MVLSKTDIVLKEIERTSERISLPIIGPEKGRILIEIIRRTKPKRVLEVGTLTGYSAILMAKELTSDAHLITIEIDADEGKIAKENIARAEVRPTIDVIVGDAIDVIPKLKGRFDMVFIDADKEESLDYLRLVEDKLRKASVVVVDNAGIFAEQMSNYLDYVRSSKKYSSRYVSVGEDGFEVSVKI